MKMKRAISRRLLSVLLMVVMVLSLCRVRAFATDTVIQVDYGSTSTSDDVLGDGTVSYDADTNTLTLNNATLTCEDANNVAIYVPNGNGKDLNLKLIGTNTINAAQCVYVDGNLIISGDGKLQATGGTTYGLYISGDLTIDGANVEASNSHPGNAGVHVIGSVSIKNNADVHVSSLSGACGIYSRDGNISIIGSNVEASPTSGASVKADGGNITITDSTVTASSTYGAGINGGDILITNSVVTATTEDEGYYDNSIGCYVGSSALEGNKVSISGGTVTATATGQGSKAIYANSDIVISDKAKVTAETTNDVAIYSSKDVSVTNSIVEAKGVADAAGILAGGIASASGSWISTSGSESFEGEITNSVLINGTTGSVIGNVVVPGDVIIPEGTTLVIPDGTSLTVPKDVALTNNGIVEGSSNVVNEGTVNCNNHTGGTATCVDKAVCRVCGQEYGNLSPHNNLTKTEEKAATCTEGGNIAYWNCSDCGKYFSDEACTTEISEAQTKINAKGHNTTKVEAKAASCSEGGNIAYWHCTECGKYFSDEAYTTETSEAQTKIDAKGHNTTKVEAKAASCSEGGNIAYWNCSECGKYFSDEACATEISEAQTKIDAKGHNTTKVEAKAASCSEGGNIAYWNCSDCGKYFSDEACATEISEAQTKTSAKGHNTTKVEAKAATCTEGGNIAYWHCSDCGKYFSDEAYTTEISEAQTKTAAKGHNTTKVEAKAATCSEGGNIAYWHCTECGKYFSDEACATEISEAQTKTAAKGHNTTKVEAKAATCSEGGNIAYWNCSECGKYFSDEACATEISEAQTKIVAKGHNTTKVEAKAATATEAGNIEYWYCADCGKYFSDEALTKEITKDSTVIAATGETPPEYQIIEGANGSWTQNTDGTLTFRANGDFDKFTEVRVDGKLIDSANYTVKSGSTIVTLEANYLKILSAGEHKLTVVFNDGECSTNFTVKTAQATNTGETAPLTGDSSNMVLWLILMAVSALGLGAVLLYGQKRKASL